MGKMRAWDKRDKGNAFCINFYPVQFGSWRSFTLIVAIFCYKVDVAALVENL